MSRVVDRFMNDARWFAVAMVLVAAGAAVGAAVSTALYLSGALGQPPAPEPIRITEVVPCPAPPPPPPPPEPSSVPAPALPLKEERKGPFEVPQGFVKPQAAPRPIKVLLRTQPVLPVALDGKRAALGAPLKLRGEGGRIVVGNARSAFRIRVDYAIRGGIVRATIDSDPWAILFDGELSRGKPPLTVELGGDPTSLTFKRPLYDEVTLVLQLADAG